MDEAFDMDKYIEARLGFLRSAKYDRLHDEIVEEYAPDRVVLECPICHRRKVLHPYRADVDGRYDGPDGKVYIKFKVECQPCHRILASAFHLDEWNGDVLKEEHLIYDR